MEKWTIMYKCEGNYGHIHIIAEEIEDAIKLAKEHLIKKYKAITKIMCVRAEYKSAN